MSGLLIEGLSHGYVGHTVLNKISIEISSGEIVCLLGPSGCGKTTLLRVAAGLERRQSGRIFVGGELVADQDVRRLPEQRGVGFMFQDFALFPHLSVAQNVAFGLRNQTAADRASRVQVVLDQVGLTGYDGAYPHTLSGGQQQRVALARALAPAPSVLLLDEPFSGLDENLRIQIREETLSILKTTGVATLMVTHNPEEAMFMADQMMVMGPGGAILQAGSPTEVYMNPANEFVASFFGQINRISAIVSDGFAATPLGPIAAAGFENGQAVTVIVRMDGIQIDPDGGEGEPVTIESARPLGRATFIRFHTKNSDSAVTSFKCRIPGISAVFSETGTTARILPDHAFIFPAVVADGSAT